MFLSRLVLDPRHRAVRADVASPTGMHRTVMSAFGEAGEQPRRELGVLHRLDEMQNGASLCLYVQSTVLPDWSSLPQGYLVEAAWGDQNPGIKDVSVSYASLERGQVFRFRLLANASKRIARDNGGSTRVPLRDDEALRSWILRKAENGGFELGASGLDIGRPGVMKDHRRGAVAVTVEAALFEGLLRVTDPGLFRRVLEAGLGPAKAYGCGLLSLAPVAR